MSPIREIAIKKVLKRTPIIELYHGDRLERALTFGSFRFSAYIFNLVSTNDFNILKKKQKLLKIQVKSYKKLKLKKEDNNERNNELQ